VEQSGVKMAVPSSGSLSMRGIFSEKNEDDYSAANMDGESNLSLRGLSSNSHSDTSTGGNINLNANFADTADGGASLDDAPYSMSEFRGYDHDYVAEIHSTTFQPQKKTWVVPYQPVRHGSGFTTSLNVSNNAPTNMGSVTTQGTFSLGGKTGVNLAALYNFNDDGDSTNGEKIVLQFHHASGTNFSNTGWSTAKIYNGSSASGTLVVTLTRSSASSYTSVIQNSSNVRATYLFNAITSFVVLSNFNAYQLQYLV
jgi:hypothetical protein